MSGKLVGQVWELRLPPAKRDLLLALADHAKDDGSDTHPGIEKLAWKLDVSERQVQRLLRSLEKDGLIVATAHPPKQPTIYRIDLAKGVLKEPFVARRKYAPKGDNLSIENVSDDNLSLQNEPSRVTSYEKQQNLMGDMPSLKTPPIRPKDHTSLKDKDKNIAEPKKRVQRQPSDWQQIVGLCMEIWECPSGIATKYAQMITGKAKGESLWAASNLNPAATLPELKGWVHWIRQSHRELPKGATVIQQSFVGFRKNQAYEDAVHDANHPAPPPTLTIVQPNPEQARLYREMIARMAEAKALPSAKGHHVSLAG